MDERPRHVDESQPADFKTACDGHGGLVRVRLIGAPHAGRSLFIDELDVPTAIYTTPTIDRFEWWPERIHELMATLPAGQGAVRHGLRVDRETREPTFESEREATPA